MPTKRTPIRRERRQQFTPEVLSAFSRLRGATYYSPEWWSAHGELHRRLGAKLWEWPCVEPPGVDAEAEAVALWRELEWALRESGV